MSLSYLPGTASLLEELDKKLMVLLRDGRTLIGENFQNIVEEHMTNGSSRTMHVKCRL